LRERARKNLGDGGITSSYKGDPKKWAIAILQSVPATEFNCVLRYTMHAVCRRARWSLRGSPHTPE
ncbi:MAG TPA: hypothetical protein VNR65_09290, partial [Geobacterales bacterium]|nr:hypothetical protein [Geobacterales bacterium]